MLIDDVAKSGWHYVTSAAFLYDLMGIVPFRGIFCFLAWIATRSGLGGGPKSAGDKAGGGNGGGVQTHWLSLSSTVGVVDFGSRAGGVKSGEGGGLWSRLFKMLLDSTRLFHLMRLHHFRQMWRYVHRRCVCV